MRLNPFGFDVPGADVEIRGVTWRFAPGHKLRLTLKSSAAPWAIPTTVQKANLVGGVYAIRRGGSYTSHVNLPLVDTAAAFPDQA